MKYTSKLGLPIWYDPVNDIFDIGDFNKANNVIY